MRYLRIKPHPSPSKGEGAVLIEGARNKDKGTRMRASTNRQYLNTLNCIRQMVFPDSGYLFRHFGDRTAAAEGGGDLPAAGRNPVQTCTNWVLAGLVLLHQSVRDSCPSGRRVSLRSK